MIYSIILYSTIAILTAILAELSVKVKTKLARNLNVFFMLFIPSLFAGLRYGIGTDYPTYSKIFEYAKYGMQTRVEIGYDYLNIIVSKLGGNVQIVLFIATFITTFFIYLSLISQKDKISVGIGMLVYMLLFYQSSFNVVRMMLAVAISLYNIKNIQERKFMKFIFWLVVAMSFHTSAIVLMPIYFMCNFISEKKYKFIRWGLYLVVFMFMLNYNQILQPIFDSISIFNYYTKYLDNSGGNTYGISLSIIYFIYLIPGFFLNRKIVEKEKRYFLFYTLLILGILLKLSGYFTAGYVDRISTYFLIVLVIVVPYYLKELANKKNLIFGYMFIIYIFVMWFLEYFYWGNHGTVPYQWVL